MDYTQPPFSILGTASPLALWWTSYESGPCADAPPYDLPLGDLEGESQVGDADVAGVVEEDVLGLAVAVHDAVRVEVVQPQQHLRSVELGPARNMGC